jgi:hypothetical protein
LPRRALARFIACCCAIAGSGCEGPRGATPLPEPPALDANRIDVPEIMPAVLGPITIEGDTRSATPGSTLRVTNLDSTAEPATTTVAADGSFAIQVDAAEGDVLRVEAERNGERSNALDFVLGEAGLTPSPRHDCIRVDPEFRLEFLESPDIQQLFFQSTCDSDAVLDGARTRLELAEFAIPDDFPLELFARDDAAVEVGFEGDAPREDVLFIDVDVNGVVIRYPFTLLAR